MIEYNIYFSHNGNNEYKRIIKHMSKLFEDFTVLEGLGYYKGNSEISKCIRIVDFNDDPKVFIKLKVICDIIKEIANQECVLFTKNEVNAQLI
jgi:hypothetical protein